MTRLVGSLALTLLTLAPRGASAAACGDAAALAAVRGRVAAQCDCADAVSPQVYKRCVSAVVQAAVAGGTLSASCASGVLRCAAKSTCGRPGAVTCCRTTASGKTKCSIKPSAAKCRAPGGGTACVGMVSSCCDACDASGGCAPPPPTTTTSTTSTTTTTSAPPVCGDGVCDGSEQCDGTDFCGASCPGGSAAGGFLACRPDCTIDFSHCGGATTTTLRGSTTTTTSTTTTSSTSTTIPNLCTNPILKLPPLVKLPIETVAASTSCGGAFLSPPPTAPFSGKLLSSSGAQLAQLGTDCLYLGGGSSSVVPFRLATGSEVVLNVVGLSGFTAIAGPSAGSGPADCSLGAGPGRHCLNGSGGTDGRGTCVSDASCGGALGSCALDANCFFGPPLPIPSPVPACAVNVALQDFCGEANLAQFSVTVHAALSTRVYLGGCPACIKGVCQGGGRAGQRCTAASNGTSIDCLPTPSAFTGAVTSVPTLTTEASQLSAADGRLCAGQPSPGAFGQPAARVLETQGQRFDLLTLQTTLAGPFCAQPSGNPLLDGVIGLPAPAAAMLKGRLNLSTLLQLFGL
ncbi:MAG TPA: hypothetical protein VKW76_08280 [Candidatus Binatia bacterium]|nr:hypothetical protein [Candidatus Binatia bacterium]